MTPWGLPAYIGPGAGFAFLGSLLSLLSAVLAGILSAVIWPFRTVWLILLRPRHRQIRKAIFLGFDGLDPVVTEKLMAEGRLPNLGRLRDQGSYRRLRTTFPALSPVAWATFATGVNPGKHNIFDSRASVELRRDSEPFWKILGRNAVKSTILRVPVTFPPEAFNGFELSATPDLPGAQGTYSQFKASEGQLKGPEGTSLPFRFRNNQLEIQNESYPLTEGEYTPWIRLRFGRVCGIVRFLLTKSEPDIAIYATPVQMDPENPALPISHPRFYAVYLAKLLGTYSTLGLAEDTWALNEGAIGEAAFLKQTELIQKEREAMFFSALKKMRRGVVACVFDTTDRVQHMFYGQPDVIEPLYCDMDRIVGEAVSYADARTAVFVLSDHGFCAFRRGVNLNSWLLREGYLSLDPDRTESGDYLDGVDWSRTRAYAFGLSGVYLNLQGREEQGIVKREEAQNLKQDLVGKLTGLVDEKDDKTAIQAVYQASDIYSGPFLNSAPDLIVGYAEGYRASWDASIGRVTQTIFDDNRKAWRGDHCVDPPLVPGVLFSNLKITTDDPGIEDLAPTALSLFGVKAPVWMEGRSVIAAA
jgi:predicted AlkP superfamily phosphohydrolase/phosphomutase